MRPSNPPSSLHQFTTRHLVKDPSTTSSLFKHVSNMPPTAPDAVDQLKKAFKGLFNKKKAKKEEPAPTATTEQPSASTSKPSETTPAAPAPATAPEPVTSENAPASTGTAPAAAPAPAPAPAPVAAPVAEPAAAPAQSESKTDEAAALAEVKQATQSRSTSLYHSDSREHGDDDCWDGSRRRQKVALDSDWDGPV